MPATGDLAVLELTRDNHLRSLFRGFDSVSIINLMTSIDDNKLYEEVGKHVLYVSG